jgi:hypothetical protein
VGHETDHSSQSSSEIKNKKSCTSTPPYAFMVCASKTCNLINWKHRLTFLICDRRQIGHIWIPWRKWFENFCEFSQNFKTMSFNTILSFILKMVENWILKMTENKYRINSITHSDSSDDYGDHYDVWESLWYCTDASNAFLVIKTDFRMCKISTCVTKSEDTIVCGNSIWQELVAEKEDVWPLCRILFL